MRRALKIANECLGMVVLFLILLLFATVIYTVRDADRLTRSARPERFAQYRPEADNSAGYEELRAENPDVIGWITIHGTNIDYPLVQGEDNETYMTKAADGAYSLAGSIFLDTRNKADLSDFNNLIYGHSMAGNAMFGDISDFTDSAFFSEHRTGDIFINGERRALQVLAIVQTDVYKSGLYRVPVVGDYETEVYLSEIRRQAMHAAEELEEVSGDDRLAVLSTCTYQLSNGRHLLICRITDEAPETQVPAKRRNIDTVGTTSGITKALRVLLVVIAGLLAAVHVTGRANKRTRNRRQEKERRKRKNLSILE